MKKTGVWLIIIGVGAFILPLIGLQFKIISIFGRYQNIVAIACVVIGIVLNILGKSDRSSQSSEQTSYGSSASAYDGQGAEGDAYTNVGFEGDAYASQGSEEDAYSSQVSEGIDYSQSMDEAAATMDIGQGAGFDNTNDQQQ